MIYDILTSIDQSDSDKFSISAGKIYEYLSRQSITEDTVPSGYIGTRRGKKQSFFRRGDRVVQYSKPLSPRLQQQYKLIPLSPDDPVVLDDARWALSSDVRMDIISDGFWELDLGAGKRVVVDMDDDTGKWSIYLVNVSDQMLGRPKLFRNLEELLPNLWDYLSDRQRAVYLKRVLPNM